MSIGLLATRVTRRQYVHKILNIHNVTEIIKEYRYKKSALTVTE